MPQGSPQQQQHQLQGWRPALQLQACAGGPAGRSTSRRVHVPRPPGALLLASISSQQAQSQWSWPWVQAAASAGLPALAGLPSPGDAPGPAAVLEACPSGDLPALQAGGAAGDSSGCDISKGPCNPLACVGDAQPTPGPRLEPPPFAPQSAAQLLQEQRALLDQQAALHEQQGQPFWQPPKQQQQQQWPAASGPSQQQQQQAPAPLLGLKALGRVLPAEPGKLLGVLGAQLLLQFANFQRGMSDMQRRSQQGEGVSSSEEGSRPAAPQRWRPRMPWQCQQEGGEGAGAAAAAARASAAWQASEAAKSWVNKGVAAERAMDLRTALACYTNAVTLEPANREFMCRLAKQWSDLTYEDGATVEQIQEVNGKAMQYAERVIAMWPQCADGYMASCVSRGRLALFSDNKTKVRLAKEAQEAARTAVSLEPGNDLAHHLMGRWHFEMAQINFVVRQLIRLVYGAALSPGRFEDALDSFDTAVRLNPRKLIHRVELGRTHLRLGHKAEAYQHLLASMALEVEDVNARLQREDAELLLAKLAPEFERQAGKRQAPQLADAASWGGFSSAGIQEAAAAAEPGEAEAGGSQSSNTAASTSSSADAAVAVDAGNQEQQGQQDDGKQQ